MSAPDGVDAIVLTIDSAFAAEEIPDLLPNKELGQSQSNSPICRYRVRVFMKIWRRTTG
jgi:hypothetical protein